MKKRADYWTKDIYKRYIERHPKGVTEKQFNAFWDALGDLLVHEIVHTASEVQFPGFMNMSIKEMGAYKYTEEGYRIRKRPVDWVATKQYHKENPDKMHVVIYHKNPHTRDRTYKFVCKPGNILKQRVVYKLKLTRNHHRYLAQELKNGKIDFYKLF
jgi:hypothetical protein